MPPPPRERLSSARKAPGTPPQRSRGRNPPRTACSRYRPSPPSPSGCSYGFPLPLPSPGCPCSSPAPAAPAVCSPLRDALTAAPRSPVSTASRGRRTAGPHLDSLPSTGEMPESPPGMPCAAEGIPRLWPSRAPAEPGGPRGLSPIGHGANSSRTPRHSQPPGPVPPKMHSFGGCCRWYGLP